MPQTNEPSQKDKENMVLHRVQAETNKTLDTKESVDGLAMKTLAVLDGDRDPSIPLHLFRCRFKREETEKRGVDGTPTSLRPIVRPFPSLRVYHHVFPSGAYCELQPNGKWKKVRWK